MRGTRGQEYWIGWSYYTGRTDDREWDDVKQHVPEQYWHAACIAYSEGVIDADTYDNERNWDR